MNSLSAVNQLAEKLAARTEKMREKRDTARRAASRLERAQEFARDFHRHLAWANPKRESEARTDRLLEEFARATIAAKLCIERTNDDTHWRDLSLYELEVLHTQAVAKTEWRAAATLALKILLVREEMRLNDD